MTDQPVQPLTTPTDPPAKAGGDPAQGTQQVNWEARYNGLNATYGKLQKKFEDLERSSQQTMAELEELRQSHKKVDGEKANLSSDLQKLQAEKAALEGRLTSAAFDKERMKLIMGEYPELAGFEAEGLLPTADTVDTLKPKLEAFRTKLGGNINAGVQKKLQGAGPAPSGKNDTNPGTHSEEYIYTRLNQLAGHRTPEQQVEYQGLQDEWDTLHK
jgi:hypothetical protein